MTDELAVAVDPDALAMEEHRGAVSEQQPPATREPLEDVRLDALSGIAMDVMLDLGQGQLPLSIPPSDDSGKMTPELFALVKGLGDFFTEASELYPELSPYAYDADQLVVSNDGLDQIAITLEKALSDRSVIRALQGPVRQKPETPEEVSSEPPSLDGLI